MLPGELAGQVETKQRGTEAADTNLKMLSVLLLVFANLRFGRTFHR